ncbi:MAG TPA: DUF58 domain-containing protein [Acidimicrobiales bacterium]|nr:DUF58 domain-containing protein [Acidimicrobiales bacterium]
MVPVPTARFVAFAASLSLAVLVVPLAVPWGFVAACVLLGVLGLADTALAVDPGAIGVERQITPTVTLGGEGEVRWRVTNPAPRRVRVSLADELAPSLHAGERRFSMTLPPEATLTERTALRPSRRGRFELTDLVVRVEGPLGLMARQRARVERGQLRVFPPFRSRRQVELRIEQAQLLEIGLRTARGSGGGTEFDALRDYTVDDEVRRIDWAATARSMRTIVRTYRAERNQQVLVLLDNGRLMAGQVAGVPRVEWGMDAAMGLTMAASALGDRCGLVTFDRVVRAVVPPGSGRSQLERVTGALYDLEPQLVESDYAGAFAATVARFRRRSLLVLVTELAEEAMSEMLVPALPLLLTRHLVIVASVSDADVTSWATVPPHDSAEAYRMAAATAARARRAQTASLLRRMGATVIDAHPDDLAARLVDTYFTIKAAGRL